MEGMRNTVLCSKLLRIHLWPYSHDLASKLYTLAADETSRIQIDLSEEFSLLYNFFEKLRPLSSILRIFFCDEILNLFIY